MNVSVNDWELDYNQLRNDEDTHKNETHATNILTEVPKLTRQSYRSTPALLSTAQSIEYLKKLSAVECGALHEMAKFDAVQCYIKKHNVCCCHNFDFGRYDDIQELFLGNQMVGIELFAIRYMLYQKGYLEEWYIKEKDFTNIQDLFFKYDVPDVEGLIKRGEKRNKTTQNFQRRVGKILMEKWVNTTIGAMDEFVESLEESGKTKNEKIIPIFPLSN